MGWSASSDGGATGGGATRAGSTGVSGHGGAERTDPPGAGSPTDRALWERLRALLTSRAREADDEPSASDFRPPARAVHEIDELAAEITAALAAADAPAGPGTARAVAASVVQLCRAFTQAWSAQPPLTPAQHREFDRDLTVVQTILDSLTGLGQTWPDQP
jgi:hypothetical protein